jgi:hypothetical protein
MVQTINGNGKLRGRWTAPTEGDPCSFGFEREESFVEGSMMVSAEDQTVPRIVRAAVREGAEVDGLQESRNRKAADRAL